MIELKLDVFIDRPPQEVFDFLSDPANLPRWNAVIRSAQWTTGDKPGVGSTYRVTAKILGPTKEGLGEIVAWDPPGRYGYAMSAPMFPMKWLETIMTLEPEGTGTRVRFNGHTEIVPFLRAFDRLFVRMGEKTDGQNLATAKQILEAS